MVRGFTIVLLLFGLAALPRRAAAEGAAVARPPARSQSVAAAATAEKDAERARLAAELDRINAEIDALKRRPRGIRGDYRLRERMADAESIARRLTDLDARAGRPGSSDAPPARPTPWAGDLAASAGDDRADLEAKADILVDQASRLTIEANRIEGRILDLRARRELRRRAGQLEQDPFSALEQAKGRVVVANGSSVTTTAGGKSGAPRLPGASDAAGGGTLAPTVSSPAPDSPGSLAAQLRGVLDPSALAEVRRLEAPGSSPSSLAAMESALRALRDRAALLARNASALRARAAKAE